MTLKERINSIRIDPNLYYDTEVKNYSNDSDKTIEDLLCVFFVGSLLFKQDIFEGFSKKILDHEDFEKNPEYQYHYFIGRATFSRYLNEMHYALDFFQKANKLSYVINDPDYIAKSLSYLCFIYDATGDSELALFYNKKALEILNPTIDPIIAADVYNLLGLILLNIGELDRSESAYKKAIDYYLLDPRAKNHVNYCAALLNLAEVLINQGEHNESEKLISEGVALAEKNGYLYFFDDLLIVIAEEFYNKKMYRKAFDITKAYVLKNQKVKKLQTRITGQFDKDILKEELSTLFTLNRENENLNKRLDLFYEKFGKKDESLSKQKFIFLELDNALKNNEITCFFQPKWSFRENRFTGAEALARWIRKDGEIIYPNVFMELIEESDMVNTLSIVIIKQALKFCKIINSKLDKPFVVSINITPYQLLNHDIVSVIERELFLNNLIPENVEIEITERTFLDNNPRSLNQLYQLKEMGVKISLDDFGTGYSSLSCLNRIPFDTVKIDRSLMINAASVGNGKKMLLSVINLLHDMDFLVLTEGAEKEEHIEILKELGSDEVQGYYYSKALCAADMIDFLEH